MEITAHFPTLWHPSCLRCRLILWLMHDHGYAGKREVTPEDLLEVLYG